jgi:hypothetical protein
MRDFVLQCKRHGVTVGAALNAAQLFGLAALIFSRQDNPPKELFLVNDLCVDLRGRVVEKKPRVSCCYNIYGSLIGVKINKTSKFWDLAKNVKEEYENILNEENKFYLFNEFSFDKMLTTDHQLEVMNSAKQRLDGLRRHSCISNWKR